MHSTICDETDQSSDIVGHYNNDDNNNKNLMIIMTKAII